MRSISLSSCHDYVDLLSKPTTSKKSLQVGEIDPRVGLTPDEVRNLTWGLVKKGVNHADQACAVTKRAYISGHGMVFMYGGYGQGKSLVLKIAVAAALNEGKRAAYANLAGVLDDIRTAYDERENKMTELVRRMEWWTSLDVLAIDELDKVGQTEWARERIFQLICVWDTSAAIWGNLQRQTKRSKRVWKKRKHTATDGFDPWRDNSWESSRLKWATLPRRIVILWKRWQLDVKWATPR